MFFSRDENLIGQAASIIRRRCNAGIINIFVLNLAILL